MDDRRSLDLGWEGGAGILAAMDGGEISEGWMFETCKQQLCDSVSGSMRACDDVGIKE